MADLVVPALGESITEAVIGKWLKAIGDFVDVDEPVLDLETDKITVQLPAPVAGSVTEHRYDEGDTVRVGDVVGQIAEGAEKPAAREATGEEPKRAEAPSGPAAGDGESRARGAKEQAREASRAARPEPAPAARSAEIPARDAGGRPLSPSMRRAAREGTAEIRARAEAPRPAPAPSPAPAPARARAEKPVVPGDREDVVAMSPLRKRIAERLVQAQQSSASLTTFNEVDMSAVMDLRNRHKESFLERHGVKLGFMSFFVKASVAALELFPGVNAEVRGDSIVYKKHYDLGIAVGTERGLVVPVLRNCDRLSFAEIESGIIELAQKARKGGLTLDDLTGGTFTITNGGIYGSMLSTPLLNYPQTGILGMHNIVERPVAVGGSVEIRPVMYVALTYDHRVVDGKEAVQFLVALKDRIEQPDRLMFDL